MTRHDPETARSTGTGSDPIQEGITSAINKHGHAFHQSVLRETERLFELRTSKFLFEAAELPVDVGDQHSRIDAVLKHRDRPTYLVLECKRVDSSTAWCFSSVPFVRRDNNSHELLFDIFQRLDEFSGQAITFSPSLSTERLFELGLPFDSGKKGDGGGWKDRDDVEKSVSQAILGAAGLINCMNRNLEIIMPREDAMIIPVVLTTAELYLSGADLSRVNLESGKMCESEIHPQPIDWLWFRYHASSRISHPVNRGQYRFASHELTLSRLLDRDHSKTVAIVNALGLSAFLSYASHVL